MVRPSIAVTALVAFASVSSFPDTAVGALRQGPAAPGTEAPGPTTPEPPTPEPTPAAPRPTITAATAPEPEAGAPGPGGQWKPAGLPGRSAFHTAPAARDDPYGPRPRGVPELSEEQITRYALENPQIASAKEKVVAAQAQLSQAKIAWIPVIDTTATLSPGANIKCDDVKLDDGTLEEFDFQFCRSGRDTTLDISTIDGYFKQLGEAGVRFAFRAETVIPVFSFGRKLKHYKSLGRAGVALAKLQALATEQETVLRVRQAHVTLLLARESQAILIEAKRVLDKAYTRVVADVGDPEDWASDDEDTGNDARDPDDLTKVELAAVELEVKMREALKVEALALSALWVLAGRAAPQGFDIQERSLTPRVVQGGLRSVAEYIDIANGTRPEAKLAGAAVQARKAQERLARAAFLPDMGIAMSFGLARSNAADPDMSRLYYQDGFNYSSFTAALAVRWRWDTGAIFELRRARAELRAQGHQEEAAKLLLSRDVQQAYQDLVEARARMDAAAHAVELSWRLVLSQELRDAGGSANASELLRALEKWYSKRYDRAAAIHAHGEALARLSRAIGAPLSTLPDAATDDSAHPAGRPDAAATPATP